MLTLYSSLKKSGSISFFGILLVNCIVLSRPCLATDYDLSNSRAEDAVIMQRGGSAGTGTGQNGAVDQGRTNISFKDFDSIYQDGNNPSDLLPIKQVNEVDGMQIHSYQAPDPSMLIQGHRLQQSGTSYAQAPAVNPGQPGRQVNPYYLPGTPGSRTTLPPTSQALQSVNMPTAFEPIKSGQYSFGFNKGALFQGYTGPYRGAFPADGAFNLDMLRRSALPPASMGSVDFNIRSR